MFIPTVFVVLVHLPKAFTQWPGCEPEGSFPHIYPGLPSQDANFTDHRAWQEYFRVKDPLTNITFTLPRNFAGNLPVNREAHPNDTLFFWGFEKSRGSLTRDLGENDDEPWGVWLNGGPGASSLLGMEYENGPIHISENGSFISNPDSWHNALDMFWVDQPVSVGYSTADPKGCAASEEDVGNDFMNFLSNLVQVFPSLSKRPFYLLDESYAGVYIPYIVKAYFGRSVRSVNLVKFAIGDGVIGSYKLSLQVPMLNVLETYPQLIDYDPAVYNAFKEQHHLCGYDLNLTYPQQAPLPTIDDDNLANARIRPVTRRSRNAHQAMKRLLDADKRPDTKRQLPRDLVCPVDSCDFQSAVLACAQKIPPWSTYQNEDGTSVDVYDIPNAISPDPVNDGDNATVAFAYFPIFYNDLSVRAALHAPTSKEFLGAKATVFQNGDDPSPRPTQFLDELVRNMSEYGMKWVLFSGNSDLFVAHFGTEAVIQNTTFGKTRGFSKKPQTPWFDKNGKMAGIVHQEHDLTYALFKDAGHLVSQWEPSPALTFLEEFIIGSNCNGTVLADGSIIGPQGIPYDNNVLPAAHSAIFTGAGISRGSTVWPSATIAAWESFIATATVQAANGSANTGKSTRDEL